MEAKRSKLFSFICTLFVILCNSGHQVESANILFFFGVSSYSHRIPAWPLATALAELGHNVTFISPFPAKNPHPKVRDYVPKKLEEWVESWDALEDPFQERKDGNLQKGWITLPEFGSMMCDVIYQDEEYVKWIKESKMDLVFIDSLFNDCAYGMVHYWKAKSIIFATSTAFSWYSETFGLPVETNWIPSMELFYPADMTFEQRLKNALVPLGWHFVRKWKYYPQLEQITRDRLGITDLPKFEEMERNASLVFLNTYFAEEFARSLPPNAIAIGGISWVEKPKPLPQDLESFVNKGNGFIYISFGTYGDFTKMDDDVKQAFITTLRSFPKVQFVWKVSNSSLIQEFPDKNVLIKEWMPQQQILAHPKIKAFISHSGLLGIQEAVTCGVPLISFPIFAEQDYNAERIHRKEVGIRLEITTVKHHQLQDAINKILTDPKYRNNMQKVSTLFKERPQKPLDVALWWTDFVLRHNEDTLAALRPSSVYQSWWVRRQLDVWVTLIGSFLTVLTLSIYIIVKIVKMLCGGSGNSHKANMKKKVQ